MMRLVLFFVFIFISVAFGTLLFLMKKSAPLPEKQVLQSEVRISTLKPDASKLKTPLISEKPIASTQIPPNKEAAINQFLSDPSVEFSFKMRLKKWRNNALDEGQLLEKYREVLKKNFTVQEIMELENTLKSLHAYEEIKSYYDDNYDEFFKKAIEWEAILKNDPDHFPKERVEEFRKVAYNERMLASETPDPTRNIYPEDMEPYHVYLESISTEQMRHFNSNLEKPI